MEKHPSTISVKIRFIAVSVRVDTCEVLLRAGCSRDARTKVDKTPLHVASQEGHTEICELLLSQGADVDARDMVREGECNCSSVVIF